jgi:hypothetical protein
VGCTAVIDAMVLRARERERRPADYRYFDRAGVFVGLGEDPHYRPPGWDRGRKVGWAKHGDPYHPPGLSKKQGPPVVVIIFDDDDHGKVPKHGHQRNQGRGRGKNK